MYVKELTDDGEMKTMGRRYKANRKGGKGQCRDVEEPRRGVKVRLDVLKGGGEALKGDDEARMTI